MSLPSLSDYEKIAPPGDLFYTAPDPLPEGEIGDPIWARPLANPTAELAAGENHLVLYLSQDARRERIATSGMIVLPDPAQFDPGPDGFPLITWAHGTVGAANVVAPSRDWGETGASPMNAYVHTLLDHFLSLGWAVAMTDYEALGTGTWDRLHPYLLGDSEAYAVLDIVHAAQRLFPGRIGRKYAIVGHSQGGQAALFAAKHGPSRVPGLVGVAAIAPANHTLGLVRLGALSAQADEGYGFTPLILAGALGGDPTINPEQVLSPTAFRLWPQTWHRSRAGLSRTDSFGGLRGTAQFRGTYPNFPNPDQQKFDAVVGAMNPDVPLSVPARISQAADDPRVRANPPAPAKGTDALVQEIDNTNKPRKVEYQRYAEGEVDAAGEPLGVHFATIDHDLTRLTQWLLDRFAES